MCIVLTDSFTIKLCAIIISLICIKSEHIYCSNHQGSKFKLYSTFFTGLLLLLFKKINYSIYVNMKGIVNIQILNAHEGSSKNYFPEVILRLYASVSGNSIIIVSRLLARIKEQSIFVLYTNLKKTHNRHIIRNVIYQY